MSSKLSIKAEVWENTEGPVLTEETREWIILKKKRETERRG